MKKIFACFIPFLFISCASISTNPSAYVEGMENFKDVEFNCTTTVNYGETIEWQDYKLVTGKTENTISQTTVLGAGKKSGALTQHGTFNKGDKELFSVTLTREIEGWVSESTNSKGEKNGSTSVYDETVTLRAGKDGPVFNIKVDADNSIIRHDSANLIEVYKVTSYINENGKIYSMWGNYSMGAKVLVDGELYAIIDYLHKPKRIRLNPDFSKSLSDEQKDLIAMLMLEIYHYEQVFKTVSVDANQSFNIF